MCVYGKGMAEEPEIILFFFLLFLFLVESKRVYSGVDMCSETRKGIVVKVKVKNFDYRNM